MKFDISFDIRKGLIRADIVSQAEPNTNLAFYFLVKKQLDMVNPFALRAAADHVE